MSTQDKCNWFINGIGITVAWAGIFFETETWVTLFGLFIFTVGITLDYLEGNRSRQVAFDNYLKLNKAKI